MNWNLVKNSSLPNLNVLSINNVELGFIQKPKDTKTCKSYWNCFVGTGENAKFLGHEMDKRMAKKKVEETLK